MFKKKIKDENLNLEENEPIIDITEEASDENISDEMQLDSAINVENKKHFKIDTIQQETAKKIALQRLYYDGVLGVSISCLLGALGYYLYSFVNDMNFLSEMMREYLHSVLAFAPAIIGLAATVFVMIEDFRFIKSKVYYAECECGKHVLFSKRAVPLSYKCRKCKTLYKNFDNIFVEDSE